MKKHIAASTLAFGLSVGLAAPSWAAELNQDNLPLARPIPLLLGDSAANSVAIDLRAENVAIAVSHLTLSQQVQQSASFHGGSGSGLAALDSGGVNIQTGDISLNGDASRTSGLVGSSTSFSTGINTAHVSSINVNIAIGEASGPAAEALLGLAGASRER